MSADPILQNSSAEQQKRERGSVTLFAMISAAGIMLSRILGLVRDIMTARYFSAEIRDAWIVAFRLPNLFRRLLGEGSLSIAFIPVFVELLQGKRKEESQQLVNAVFAILMVITVCLSLLGIVFMDDILRLLLSGDEYNRIAGKFELTVRLARIMFSFLVLVSLYAFFMAILNSLRQFALAAVAPALLNIALISAALVSDRWVAPEEALAWGVIVGGVLQMGILIPSVIRSGYFPKFTLKWNTPEVKRVLWAVVPSLFGMSIMQVTQIVNTSFASHLPQGAHSALYFADRILELPLAIFVVSVGSALLPTLSRYRSDGDAQGMAETVNHYIRLILFVSLPAAVGMYWLAQPITEVLFLGNQFTLEDAIATAQVIQVYAFGLLITAGVRILAQAFYAVQNTWFPATAATVSLVSHLIFATALIQAFGLNGLAASTVCSAAVNLIMLVVAYNAWVGKFQFGRLFLSFAKFVVGAAVMVAVLMVHQPLGRVLGDARFAQVVTLLVTIGLGGTAYMGVAHLLKVPEYHETVATFGGKIKSRLGRFLKRKKA